MSEHEWKIGDWAEVKSGRRLVVDVEGCWIASITKSKMVCFDYFSDLTHLPCCNSWDWQPPKPIEPPEGYRLLDLSELIIDGDILWSKGKLGYTTIFVRSSIGKTPSEVELGYGQHFARKIEPKYRPFANAAEYKPFRKLNCIDKSGTAPVEFNVNLDAYCDRGVFGIRFRTNSIDLIPWPEAFELFQFEDGTPFGVKE